MNFILFCICGFILILTTYSLFSYIDDLDDESSIIKIRKANYTVLLCLNAIMVFVFGLLVINTTISSVAEHNKQVEQEQEQEQEQKQEQVEQK